MPIQIVCTYIDCLKRYNPDPISKACFYLTHNQALYTGLNKKYRFPPHITLFPIILRDE